LTYWPMYAKHGHIVASSSFTQQQTMAEKEESTKEINLSEEEANASGSVSLPCGEQHSGTDIRLCNPNAWFDGPSLTDYADTTLVSATGYIVELNRALLASVSPMLSEALRGIDSTTQVEIKTEATDAELKQFYHFATRGVVVTASADLSAVINLLSMFGVVPNYDHRLVRFAVPYLPGEVESIRSNVSSSRLVADHVIEGQVIDEYLSEFATQTPEDYSDDELESVKSHAFSSQVLLPSEDLESYTVEPCDEEPLDDIIRRILDKSQRDFDQMPVVEKQPRKRDQSVLMDEIEGDADMKKRVSKQVLASELSEKEKSYRPRKKRRYEQTQHTGRSRYTYTHKKTKAEELVDAMVAEQTRNAPGTPSKRQNKTYQCSTCPEGSEFTTTKKHSLEAHMRSVHKADKKESPVGGPAICIKLTSKNTKID